MIKPKMFKYGDINLIYIDWFEITKYLMFLCGIVASVGVWGLLVFDSGQWRGLAVTILSFLLCVVISIIVNIIRQEHKFG